MTIDLQTNMPPLETIHPEQHYAHLYYNPDLKIYMAFSDQGYEDACRKEHLAIRAAVNVDDFPSVYHIHKEEHPVFAMYGFDMFETGKAMSCHRGATFMSVQATRNDDANRNLIVREEDVYKQAQLGLVFLAESGLMTTHPEIKDRWQQVDDVLKQNLPKNKAKKPFALKLNSSNGP